MATRQEVAKALDELAAIRRKAEETIGERLNIPTPGYCRCGRKISLNKQTCLKCKDEADGK